MTEVEPSIERGLVSLKLDAIEASSVEASSVVEDGDMAFLFDLPDEGLALRSVAIVDGTPELRFEASPKVPTLQEEDFAVAFRLAAENKRPGFFYTNFPPDHPLSLSRMFMQYSPGWLRWTDIGKLLADVDWIMKCMHIGTRTNENKTVFQAWSKCSKLKDLGTRVDFPKDGLGPTIMSCDHARVQKSNNEIRFPEEPKIKITDGCSSMYSKYITKVLSSIAYHDVTQFLKMPELIKLILAVEWLYKEKGVRVNKEWVQMHTSKPAEGNEGDNQNKLLSKKRLKPPHKMVPKISVFNCPTTDVAVGTWEAEMNGRLRAEYKVRRLYGYFDFGASEVVMFKEDGSKGPSVKSLKTRFDYYINGDNITCLWLYLPIEEGFTMNQARDKFLEVFRMVGVPHVTCGVPLPAANGTIIEDNTDEKTVKLKFTRSHHLSPPLALTSLDKTLVVTASVENSSEVFASKNPNDPIQIEIPGVCEAIIPDVSSWEELISELSVPIPRVWMWPYYGHGLPSSWGGVTSKEFRVREEPLPAASVERSERRSEYRDNFKRTGRTLAVVADRVVARGSISWVDPRSAEFVRISAKFSGTWDARKESVPTVVFIFSITNEYLQQQWMRYRQDLQRKRHPPESEEHFHGTELACDIQATQRLCKAGKCGVCGISTEGMKQDCIGKNIDFQRFGKGYYLAPNSSKCHDYTEQNGRGCRALLLCDVLPGQKYRMEHMSQRLKRPPQGYDCVYGVVGAELNYREIVLYDSHAILPRFIIGYKQRTVC